MSAIGHSHPRVVAAIADQSTRLTCAHRGAFTSDAAEEMGERLARMTGFPGVWLVGSGSEATEAAMQFALQYQREVGQPQRTTILAGLKGYHGNALGALSASGHARRGAVAGIALETTALPTGDAFRDQHGRTEAQYAEAMLAEAERIIRTHSDTLAAVMIEPVSGAALGATTHPRGYLAGVKHLCEEHGALFIADEVMTGMGRTGTMLASEHDEVVPDVGAMGKGLGAGYTPIAAVLLSEKVLGAIGNGSGFVLGGHTYAGNPLSAATARDLAAACMRHGLVVYPTTGGMVDAVIIAPPLTITDVEIEALVEALDRALIELAGR